MICFVCFEGISSRDFILWKWLWKTIDIRWLCHTYLHKPHTPEVSHGRIGTHHSSRKARTLIRVGLSWRFLHTSQKCSAFVVLFFIVLIYLLSQRKKTKNPIAGLRHFCHPSGYIFQKQVYCQQDGDCLTKDWENHTNKHFLRSSHGFQWSFGDVPWATVSG